MRMDNPRLIYIREYLRHRKALAELNGLYMLQQTHLRLKRTYRKEVLSLRNLPERIAA